MRCCVLLRRAHSRGTLTLRLRGLSVCLRARAALLLPQLQRHVWSRRRPVRQWHALSEGHAAHDQRGSAIPPGRAVLFGAVFVAVPWRRERCRLPQGACFRRREAAGVRAHTTRSCSRFRARRRLEAPVWQQWRSLTARVCLRFSRPRARALQPPSARAALPVLGQRIPRSAASTTFFRCQRTSGCVTSHSCTTATAYSFRATRCAAATSTQLHGARHKSLA